jgi:hypothetical protein
VREEAQAAHAIVHADDDDALFGKVVARVKRRLAMDQRAAIDPDHNRQLPSSTSWTPHVERQAILRFRHIIGLHAFAHVESSEFISIHSLSSPSGVKAIVGVR